MQRPYLNSLSREIKPNKWQWQIYIHNTNFKFKTDIFGPVHVLAGLHCFEKTVLCHLC